MGQIIRAALSNRAGHYIFVLWFLLSSSLFMAALRSRCGQYIFALWFLMVALCNTADHYIFAL